MVVGAERGGIDRRRRDHLHRDRRAQHKLNGDKLRQRDAERALPPAPLMSVVCHLSSRQQTL
jgi:hypothetical protein